jgi:hypothetical protein
MDSDRDGCLVSASNESQGQGLRRSKDNGNLRIDTELEEWTSAVRQSHGEELEDRRTLLAFSCSDQAND